MEGTKTCLLLLLLLIGICHAQIVEPPANTVQRVGQSARLRCTAHVGYDVLVWREYVTDTRGRRIYDTYADDVYDDRYEVVTSHKTYELVIRDVSAEDAGKYECGLLRANENHMAELVVITPLSCGSIPLEATLGEHVTLSSVASYYGDVTPDRFSVSFLWYMPLYRPDKRAVTNVSEHSIRTETSVRVRADTGNNQVISLLVIHPVTAGGRHTKGVSYVDTCTIDVITHD